MISAKMAWRGYAFFVTETNFKLEGEGGHCRDRKSTRLNSSHSSISYAVFCLKKKKDVRQHVADDAHVKDSQVAGDEQHKQHVEGQVHRHRPGRHLESVHVEKLLNYPVALRDALPIWVGIA